MQELSKRRRIAATIIGILTPLVPIALVWFHPMTQQLPVAGGFAGLMMLGIVVILAFVLGLLFIPITVLPLLGYYKVWLAIVIVYTAIGGTLWQDPGLIKKILPKNPDPPASCLETDEC